MTATAPLEAAPLLCLRAETAADLMTSNPVSVREDATLREAIALLADRGYSAAPVIDAAGWAVGVLSRSDVLAHDREHVEHLAAAPECYDRAELTTEEDEPLGDGFQVERTDPTQVADLMTPAVLSVGPDTPAAHVVRDMLDLRVHRLFVVDQGGVLVGVISALDVLRCLQP